MGSNLELFPVGTARVYPHRIPISLWASEDRPSTKILLKGKFSMSNVELLSILINSGTRKINAVEIAREILSEYNDDLNQLSRANSSELARFTGIGPRKAAIILAAIEFGNRKRSQEAFHREKFAGSRDVFEIFASEIGDSNYESFWVLLLNRANRMIKKVNISEGGISGTVADPKRIFKMAVDMNACSIILCHNHPSGNIQPSETDIRLTRKLKECGVLLDLPILDHVIIGGDTYFSFADEGML